MGFAERIVELRKRRGLSQRALAESIKMSKIQVHRYEVGASQPTLTVLRRLVTTLGVSADQLLFGTKESDPDYELRMQFDAISRFSKEEKSFVKEVLDGVIMRRNAKCWSSKPSSSTRVDAGANQVSDEEPAT